MSGGQEKNFSILGPKLSDSKAQQYYGDKTRQICVQLVDYLGQFPTVFEFYVSNRGNLDE